MSSESFCAVCGRPTGSGHETRCYEAPLAERFKGRTDIKHPPVNSLGLSNAATLHKVASDRNLILQAERDAIDKRLIEELIVRWVGDIEEINADMARQGYYQATAELWIGRDWENPSTMMRCVRKASEELVAALKEAGMYMVLVDFRFNEERVYIKSSWNPGDAEDEED